MQAAIFVTYGRKVTERLRTASVSPLLTKPSVLTSDRKFVASVVSVDGIASVQILIMTGLLAVPEILDHLEGCDMYA